MRAASAGRVRASRVVCRLALPPESMQRGGPGSPGCHVAEELAATLNSQVGLGDRSDLLVGQWPVTRQKPSIKHQATSPCATAALRGLIHKSGALVRSCVRVCMCVCVSGGA
jgi:hypothetical protein